MTPTGRFEFWTDWRSLALPFALQWTRYEYGGGRVWFAVLGIHTAINYGADIAKTMRADDEGETY